MGLESEYSSAEVPGYSAPARPLGPCDRADSKVLEVVSRGKRSSVEIIARPGGRFQWISWNLEQGRARWRYIFFVEVTYSLGPGRNRILDFGKDTSDHASGNAHYKLDSIRSAKSGVLSSSPL